MVADNQTKEARQDIRDCKTPTELKDVIDGYNTDGFCFGGRSNWGNMYFDSIIIFPDKSVMCLFPLMGVRRYKDFKSFSYNTHLAVSKKRHIEQCYLNEV